VKSRRRGWGALGGQDSLVCSLSEGIVAFQAGSESG
jgi:hypothetical protein